MSFYNKSQVALLASVCSPFYRMLFQGIDVQNVPFESLPIATIDQVQELARGDHQKFIGLSNINGICFTSSGTTGIAKLTKFDSEEWKITNNLIAHYHFKNGYLRNNDIVANLSFPGHASFILVHDVLAFFPGPISEISIGADQEFGAIYNYIYQLNVNVLTGVYSTFLGLADYMVRNGLENTKIRHLLGGGEMVYGIQMKLLKAAFPNAELRSFLYGSTDAGNIGYNITYHSEDCFTPFQACSFVEIVDEKTLKPILKLGEKGLVLITNLLRTNAPVVRYSNGDYAKWVTSPTLDLPIFQLIGRKYPSISFSGSSITGNDVFIFIKRILPKVPLVRIEFEINSSTHGDELFIQFAVFDSLKISNNYEKILLQDLIDYLSEFNFNLKSNSISAKQTNLSEFTILSRKRGKMLVDKRNY